MIINSPYNEQCYSKILKRFLLKFLLEKVSIQLCIYKTILHTYYESLYHFMLLKSDVLNSRSQIETFAPEKKENRKTLLQSESLL